MREARVMLRQWGVSDSDIESLASILRSQDFDVETGPAFEKSIEPILVQGIWFVIRIAADESLRELVRLVWHTVLDRIRAISDKKGPTRVDVDFRAPGPDRYSGDLEFRIQARTNEPDAVKYLDRMVTRLSELGIVSILSRMPKGTYVASADRDIEHGEEFLGTYANAEFYGLDLSNGSWVPKRPKSTTRGTRKRSSKGSHSSSRPQRKKGRGPGRDGPA